MVMRVGGIASGMDIEAMVNKLMEAERMPLVRLQQQQMTLEWKRDAFRDVNSVLLELDNMMLDMKLSRTYQPKTAASSQESAVTATASSSASNGTYEISVSQLATNAMNVSSEAIEVKGNEKLDAELAKTYKFRTFDENGNEQEHSFEVREGDTLNQVLQRITNDSTNNVRAFLDENSGKVILETTRTGVYNPNSEGELSGPEIVFDSESNAFFTNVLKLNSGAEHRAQNAEFTYNNNLQLTSRNNNYSLNGIDFQFNNVTEGNARVTVTADVDQSFDAIMKFVDTYNKAIDQMNGSQREEKYRDFHPLTEEQKAEMTDKQIEQWEEKAKSGLLRGESSISNGMSTLRQSMQSVVETGGEFRMLSEIGIKTTQNYMDGGKLVVDEEQLKAALRDNPEDVFKLFSNNAEGSERGIINRFEDALDATRGRIEEQAGRSTQTLDNYTIGKRIKELNERISDFENRMVRVEQRYWNQFTQMEKAISNLNQQSSYLFSQFGGM